MGEKNLGVYNVEFITIDIDSLSGTGAEPFPDAETGIQNKEGAVVDAAAGTDVGEVRIRVEGRR